MSTYHYFVCDDCKERTDGAAKNPGGYCPYGDGTHTIWPFIIYHSGHQVRIVNEHHEDSYSDDFMDWTKENVKSLHERKRP